MKNSAYLRFVKYEHYLLFTGVIVALLPLILIASNIPSYLIYAGTTALCLGLTILFHWIFSIKFIGLFTQKHTGILLSVIPLLTIVISIFSISTAIAIIFFVMQELYWRGIFIEILKRQGFNDTIPIIVAALLSAISYSFQIHPIFVPEIFSAIFLASCLSGIMRLKLNIYASLYLVIAIIFIIADIEL